MKRSSSASAHTFDSPPKKQKRSPSESESETSSAENDQKWVKVEKRKSKKAKKLDAKLDVCVSHSSTRIHPAQSTQAAPPRFLYVNQEILKRRDPVSINVRRSVNFSHICVLTLRLGCSRPCPSHHSRFTATELDQSTEHAKHTKARRSSCPRFDFYRPFSSSTSHLSHEEPKSTNTHTPPLGSSTPDPIRTP